MSRRKSAGDGARPSVEATPEVELDTREAGLFDLVSNTVPAPRIDGLAIGKIASLSSDGQACVEFAENPRSTPIAARSVTSLGPGDVGRRAALMFEAGDPLAPIVMGLIHESGAQPSEETADSVPDRLVIEARSEIELRCGDSSILLTRDGKVRIRGKEVLSRASGANRVKGASVRIN